MSSPAKLTDTQRAILSEASERKDRCLIAPKTLKAAAAQKVATKLLKAGLVREIKAKTGMEAWRRDEETGQAYSLKLTDAGLNGGRSIRPPSRMDGPPPAVPATGRWSSSAPWWTPCVALSKSRTPWSSATRASAVAVGGSASNEHERSGACHFGSFLARI